MKKIQLFWILILMIGSRNLIAQDSLTIQILDPLTYEFDIVDGRLVGEGADFLINEINKVQFTLLGEFAHSKNVGDFTTALIPEFNKANYKTMALGIGSISNQILENLNHQPDKFIEQLRLINDKYSFKDKGNTHVPIQELMYQTDANYFIKAKEYGWSTIGIGRETWTGLAMLIDFMYKNLTTDLQKKHKASYEDCSSSLKKICLNRNGGLEKFYNEVKQSKAINDFLKISSKEKNNAEALLEFEYCMNYILRYVQKEYFKKNQVRVQNEKVKLKRQTEVLNIDWTKDKMFVKWDHNFIQKGIQPNPVYGLGNLLHELATFNGNQSLHIGMLKRFYLKDGVLHDELENKNQWIKDQSNFIQMGKQSKWVVINVRPLLEGLYYFPIKYLANEKIKTLIAGYDLIIIPKVESAPASNFTKK